MSCQFAHILERELQAAGLSPHIDASGVEKAGPRLPSVPSANERAAVRPRSADSTMFSPKAVNLSHSFRQYAHDAARPGQSDPSLVTGWNEAGYLRDAGRGLSGELRFTTASGVLVNVESGADGQGGADVRVRAVRDGVEHSFSFDEVSRLLDGMASRVNGNEEDASPVLARMALPAGEADGGIGAAEKPAGRPRTFLYSASALPTGGPTGIPRAGAAESLVC